MKPVKFLLTLIVIGSLSLIISCKDDEESANPLIGTWEFVSEVVSECDDADFNGTETCTSSCDRIVVSATTITQDTDVLNYTLDGNKILIEEKIGSITVTSAFTYTLTGDQLTITFKEDALTGNCKTVTTFKRV